MRLPIALTLLSSLTACAGPPEPAAAPATEPAVAAAPVELIRHTVESDRHPMALWEKRAGDPEGAILLVHGRTWSARPDFDLQVPGEDLSLMDGLVAEGFAVYGLDLRGYGETPRDDTGWNTPMVAANDAANVLAWITERHGGEPPVLFGWSLGSMVALLTAQQRADLMRAVVLFGFPVALDEEIPADPGADAPPREPTTAEAAASDFVTPDSISQVAIDAYVEAALAADPVRMDWRNQDQWNALTPEDVNVPTLVIQGETDPLAPTDRQATLFPRLGTADKQWVVVAGGDHAAFLETPRAYFIDALVNFLRRPRPAG